MKKDTDTVVTSAKKQRCPRRNESPNPEGYGDGTATPDHWQLRHGRKGPRFCSYCGSLHPDDFMAVAREGGGVLGPTDKNYKVYVTIESVQYTPTSTVYTNGKKEKTTKLPRQTAQLKFYFQHLSDDQRREFVDLYNARPRRTYDENMGFIQAEGTGMLIGYPGYLYSGAFFMRSM